MEPFPDVKPGFARLREAGLQVPTTCSAIQSAPFWHSKNASPNTRKPLLHSKPAPWLSRLTVADLLLIFLLYLKSRMATGTPPTAPVELTTIQRCSCSASAAGDALYVCQVATMTNGSVSISEGCLQRAGLAGAVAKAMDVTAVQRWKPAGAVYAHAAAQLGLAPDQAREQVV